MERKSVREESNPQSPWSRKESVEKLEARSGREWFLIWKAKVKGILQRLGIWDVVDPDQNVDSQSFTPDAVLNEKFLQWKRTKARDVIQSGVAFEIECNSDPRECWIYLQKTIVPNTDVHIYECLRLLWNMRMQDAEEVPAFRSRVQHVLDHLRDMGALPDEKLLVLLLIDALPRNWRRAAAAYRREAEFETTLRTAGDLFTNMRLDEIQAENTDIVRGLDPGQGEVPRQEV